MSQHTPAALRIARILLNGAPSIRTEYGIKTVQGLADLVDRETAAPRMLPFIQRLAAKDHGHTMSEPRETCDKCAARALLQEIEHPGTYTTEGGERDERLRTTD